MKILTANFFIFIIYLGDWEKDAMRGPLEILLGLGIGIIWGLIAGYMPHKSEVR